MTRSKKKENPIEVLMYIQNIRKYFETNEVAQQYFALNGDDDAFYEHIAEISKKNFEDNGEPELTIQQFEELRQMLSGVSEEKEQVIGIFISMGGLGYISLN